MQDLQCYQATLNLTHARGIIHELSVAKLRLWPLPCPVYRCLSNPKQRKPLLLLLIRWWTARKKPGTYFAGCSFWFGFKLGWRAGVRQQSKLSHAERQPRRWSAEAKLWLPKRSWSPNLTFLPTVLRFTDSFQGCCRIRQWSELIFEIRECEKKKKEKKQYERQRE